MQFGSIVPQEGSVSNPRCDALSGSASHLDRLVFRTHLQGELLGEAEGLLLGLAEGDELGEEEPPVV